MSHPFNHFDCAYMTRVRGPWYASRRNFVWDFRAIPWALAMEMFISSHPLGALSVSWIQTGLWRDCAACDSLINSWMRPLIGYSLLEHMYTRLNRQGLGLVWLFTIMHGTIYGLGLGSALGVDKCIYNLCLAEFVCDFRVSNAERGILGKSSCFRSTQKYGQL